MAVPLFLYYAFHSSCVGYDAHGPGGDALQPDAQFYAAAAFIDHPDRRANHAMVALMDADEAQLKEPGRGYPGGPL